MNGFKGGMLRWAVNTNAWNPTRNEWVIAMKLVDNDEERTKINRFVHKKDAKHSIIGRLLIRKCCDYFIGANKFSLSAERSPNRVIVQRSEKGKPILVEIDSNGTQVPYDLYQFNISHSGDYCVLAADSNTPKLGIDVMKIEYNGGMNRLNDFFRIMHRQFSEDEWKYIKFPDSDQKKLARFIRLWSLKESFVKAEGSGLVFPLSRISFTCSTELTSPYQKNPFDSVVSINRQNVPEWQFEECMIDKMHHISVAKIKTENMLDLDPSAYKFQLLTIKDLINDFDASSIDLFNFDAEKYWTDFCRKA